LQLKHSKFDGLNTPFQFFTQVRNQCKIYGFGYFSSSFQILFYSYHKLFENSSREGNYWSFLEKLSLTMLEFFWVKLYLVTLKWAFDEKSQRIL